MCKCETTAGVGGLGRHAGIINLSCDLYLRFPALIFSSFVNLKHTHTHAHKLRSLTLIPSVFPQPLTIFFRIRTPSSRPQSLSMDLSFIVWIFAGNSLDWWCESQIARIFSPPALLGCALLVLWHFTQASSLFLSLLLARLSSPRLGGDAGKWLVIFNLHTAVTGPLWGERWCHLCVGPSVATRYMRKTSPCQRGEKTYPLLGAAITAQVLWWMWRRALSCTYTWKLGTRLCWISVLL